MDFILNIFTPANLIIIGFTIISYLLGNYAMGKVVEKHTNLTTVFLRNAVRTFIVATGIFIFLNQYSIFEKALSSILTNSALIVAVLGFILQNSLKNLLAGLMLLSSETFKIGDRIRIPEKNITGEIEALTIRHTTIKLITNERAIIPNSIMNEAIVINNDIIESITKYPLSILVPLNYNIKKAKKIVENAIKEDKRIIEAENSIVTLSHITDKGTELKCLITTENINTSFEVISDLKEEIMAMLYADNAFK